MFLLVPPLPPKKNEMGSEILASELQSKLEIYINQILAAKVFEKLVCLQAFLSEGYIDFL